MFKQKGFMRKRCNWGHNDETNCMTDWEVDTPGTSVNYGCGSQCETLIRVGISMVRLAS